MKPSEPRVVAVGGDSRDRALLLERLAQERETIATLRLSVHDWTHTCLALERQVAEEREAEGEGGEQASSATETDEDNLPVNPDPLSRESEFKTRYQNQQDNNRLLGEQILLLQHQIKEGRAHLKTLFQGGELRDLSSNNINKTLIALKRQEQNLQSQLRDYEWRLDREGLTFSKVSEKREALVKDISQLRGIHKSRRQQAEEAGKPPSKSGSRRQQLPSLAVTPAPNLPFSHRVRTKASKKESTNPVSHSVSNKVVSKKGYIPRKSALVRKLPKLKEREHETK